MHLGSGAYKYYVNLRFSNTRGAFHGRWKSDHDCHSCQWSSFHHSQRAQHLYVTTYGHTALSAISSSVNYAISVILLAHCK
jgi:hypothetical protein